MKISRPDGHKFAHVWDTPQSWRLKGKRGVGPKGQDLLRETLAHEVLLRAYLICKCRVRRLFGAPGLIIFHPVRPVFYRFGAPIEAKGPWSSCRSPARSRSPPAACRASPPAAPQSCTWPNKERKHTNFISIISIFVHFSPTFHLISSHVHHVFI